MILNEKAYNILGKEIQAMNKYNTGIRFKGSDHGSSPGCC